MDDQREKNRIQENLQSKLYFETVKRKRENFQFADVSQQLLFDKNNEDILILSDKLTEWSLKLKPEDTRRKELNELIYCIWRISNYVQTLETTTKSAVSELCLEREKNKALYSEIRFIKLESMNEKVKFEHEVKSLRSEIEFLTDG